MKKLTKILFMSMFIFMFAFLASCSSNNVTNTSTTTVEKNGKNVYFAAPLFSDAERDYNLKITNIIESYGYKVFLPQRDGLLAPDLEGLTEKEKMEKIFNTDYNAIMNSDIVFMILDGRVPDEGACVELGIAYANNKRCYGFKSDSRSIEMDLNLNPMISECFIKLFYNLDGEKLINELKDYLSANAL